MNMIYTEDTMTYVRMLKYADDTGNKTEVGRLVYLYPMNFKPNNDKCYEWTELGSLFGYNVIAPQGTSMRPPKTDLEYFKDKLRSLLDED